MRSSHPAPSHPSLLSTSQVTGLPPQLTLLQSLVSLDLSANFVLDTMQNLVGIVTQMPALEQLILIQDRIQGEIDCRLFNETNLSVVYINNGNLLTGPLDQVGWRLMM